jgi:predicted glycoside hydrolase/deacetylase ChbG (UPF0249 family)
MEIGGLTWERFIVGASWRRAKRYPQAKSITVVGIEAIPWTSKGFSNYLDKLERGVHELYCHPGSPKDADLASISSLREKRVEELELLCSPGFKQVLEEHKVVLTSFKYFGEERVK